MAAAEPADEELFVQNLKKDLTEALPEGTPTLNVEDSAMGALVT